MRFDASFVEQVLAGLATARLEAIVVGNVAAMLQGAPVTTQDLDLLIRDTKRNREKLRALGAALAVPPPTTISEFTSTMRMYGLPWPVDFLLDRIGGDISFSAIKARAVEVKVGEQTALVASLSDVIRSKEAANRAKDRAVLPILHDTLRVRRALGEDE